MTCKQLETELTLHTKGGDEMNKNALNEKVELLKQEFNSIDENKKKSISTLDEIK